MAPECRFFFNHTASDTLAVHSSWTSKGSSVLLSNCDTADKITDCSLQNPAKHYTSVTLQQWPPVRQAWQGNLKLCRAALYDKAKDDYCWDYAAAGDNAMLCWTIIRSTQSYCLMQCDVLCHYSPGRALIYHAASRCSRQGSVSTIQYCSLEPPPPPDCFVPH